ncbi:MAG: tRNA epoxyqueuosine(34) reductase QueG [Fuerstiella sp.]
MSESPQVTDRLKAAGRDLGFDVIRIARAVSPPGFHPLLEWISRGYDADMEWIRRRQDAYQHPNGVLPGTRSVVVAGMNYHNASFSPSGVPQVSPTGASSTAAAPVPEPRSPASVRVARYAAGPVDYHDVLRRRLKQLAVVIREQLPNERTRGVVDTAPLLERDFARLAGIGWFGKNTMLISREIGSWFFLGALLTTASLSPDDPVEHDYCGSCTRCLDACPTNAFPEPRVLDSNRCISYLTIEHRDKSISDTLRSGMDNWIFGCDICQEVCPWNRFAPAESIPEFRPREELQTLSLADILQLTESDFQKLFAGTPLQRTGRAVIVRNASIAAGNTGGPDLVPVLTALQNDDSELVRESAAWAITRITGRNRSPSDGEAPDPRRP